MTDSRDDELGRILSETGADVPAARIEELERRVEADPDDLEARAELLGHFSSLDDQHDKFAPHLKYLIAHRPRIKMIDYPYVGRRRHPELFDEIRSLWLSTVEKESDLKVALHALHAIGYDSFADGQRLIDLGLLSTPDDVQWLRRSALFYLWHGQHDRSVEMFERASDLFQKALVLAERPWGRAQLRVPAIISALEARQYDRAAALADEMLSAGDDSLHFKHLKHYAHTALGEIALRKGDVDQAERHLIASVQDISDFVLDHFEPRFELAGQLVEHGRRDAVITFFEEMLKQWPKGSDTVTPWLEELRAGK